MLKAKLSRICLAGFDEWSATTGLKKCPNTMLAAVGNIDNAFLCDPARPRKGWWLYCRKPWNIFEYNECKISLSTG